MTFQELQRICDGKNLPICAKNEDGENVIIERGCDKWAYDGQSWERHFFKLQTAQANGWTRFDFIFDDGATETFYSR